MNVKTESIYTGEFLVSEGNNSISREKVILAADLEMLPVTVLGKVTADSSYKPVDPTATDGTEVTAGVLYAGATTDNGGGEGVIVARLAEVVDSLLVWPAGITAGEKTTATTQLASLDIILRTE